MTEFLLDANHLIPLLHEKHEHRASIVERMTSLPSESHICVAAATLAELEVGCCFQEKGREQSQAEIREVIRRNRLDVRPFTHHTAAEYGNLKAALMRKFAREGLKKAAKWPELWTSPIKGQSLGADEFDLIVMSHAVERNAVLVTTDPMARLVDGIDLVSTLPRFENWADAKS